MHRNKGIEQPLQFCYTLDPGSTCTEDQVDAVLNGSATICRYIVKDRNSTQLFPELMGTLGEEGCGSRGVTSTGTSGTGNGTYNPPPPPYTGGAASLSMISTVIILIVVAAMLC